MDLTSDEEHTLQSFLHSAQNHYSMFSLSCLTSHSSMKHTKNEIIDKAKVSLDVPISDRSERMVGVKSISSSFAHTLLLTHSGEVYGWGNLD
ncbi:hypothetical protein P9112_006153 [Eukaryota sp. TZLM1-RC]